MGGSVTDCGKVAVYDWPPTVYWTDIDPIGLVQDALKKAAMARIPAALCRPSSALPAGSSSATTAAIDEPLSLAPVASLPQLRTVSVLSGTLADPLEITQLPGFEFLELRTQEWRTLLDTSAVPRGLLAAAVHPDGGQDPIQLVAVANELLALWDRPRIAQIILEGNL